MRNPLVPLTRIAALGARHRTALLIAAALGFGLLAVFGARGYLAERLEIEKARLAPTEAMVEVVVARRDLERGAVVEAETMAVREVPADFVPGSAVRPERFEQHVGARLAQPMRSGEPLLVGAIVGADVGTFSTRIRQGIRAMSILVDEVNSVSGMLQPGDRIDLLFTVRPPVAPGSPPAQEVTSTLMQDLAVLATGRQVRAGDAEAAGGQRHFTAITVEVSPAQAQELIVAQRTGKLTAMLRHPDDRKPLPARALDLNALLGIDPPDRIVTVTRPAGPEIIVGGRGSLAPLPATSARVPIEDLPGASSASVAAAGDDARPEMQRWALHAFAPAANPTPVSPQPPPALPHASRAIEPLPQAPASLR